MKRPPPIKAKKTAQPIPKLKPDDIVRVRFTGGFKESITDMRFKLFLWFKSCNTRNMEIIERTKAKPDRDWTYEPPMNVTDEGKNIR